MGPACDTAREGRRRRGVPTLAHVGGKCAIRILLLALLLLAPRIARAHVGSPDVFFDGQAGPYPVQIVIRMPPVVPGRAQIEVRPQTQEPLAVSFLPLYAKTAIKNAPPAEMAQPVAGDPGLYRGELWLMSVGAYTIEVRLAGASGEGAARIPVNSVATHQLPLPPFLRNLLLALGGLLTFGSIAIVYAAAGESVLEPGAVMQRANRKKGLAAGAITAVVLALALAGGWYWWQVEEQDFRRNLRAGAWPDLTTTVDTAGSQRILHLVLGEKAFRPDYALPLLPDHGKLLHLFLIREPSLDVFAHLHPIRKGGKTFDLVLPEIPEGQYRIFCDLTLSDSGLSSTATASVHIPPPPAAGTPTGSDTPPGRPTPTPSSLDLRHSSFSATDAPPAHPVSPPPQADPDDSSFVASTPSAPTPSTDTTVALPGGRQAIWKAHPPLHAQHDAHLEFLFRDATGQPLPLEPYMGMMSHAAILRADGAIFAHLHPTGNYSMAAQSYFTTKIAREIAKANGTAAPAEMDHSKMHHDSSGPPPTSITLPYEFPTPGEYHIWVQIKTAGQVLTAAFETSVEP